MHTADLGVLVTLLGNLFWEMFTELGGALAAHTRALGKLLLMIWLASKHFGVDPPSTTLPWA